MNYRELYELGTDRLMKAGIAEYRLDARLLLEYVCETDRSFLLAHGEEAVLPEKERHFLELVSRREGREPLQYITGTQCFMGLDFKVTPEVLIPRADTEVLVEEVMRELHDGMSILDMCTGSGCILLSLLHYSNNCTGAGCDISAAALEVAEHNSAGLGHPAEFIRGDLFENVESGRHFDIIVSNPPYVRTKVIGTLEPEVRCCEPYGALDGGEDGLVFYRRIAAEAKQYFPREGRIFFETGFDQAKEVAAILEKEGYSHIYIRKDLSGLDRVVKAVYIRCGMLPTS